MPSYLVECYVAASPEALANARAQALRAADLGSGITYLRTTFLPGDETILHLFHAPSSAALDAAARRAGLRFERIVEAVEAPTGSER